VHGARDLEKSGQADVSKVLRLSVLPANSCHYESFAALSLLLTTCVPYSGRAPGKQALLLAVRSWD
jgi:hypothetical protein